MRPAPHVPLAAAVAAALLAGCATRALPPAFPPTAAASPAASAGAETPVDTTLRRDPPLPGEPTDGWAGLEEAPAEERSPALPPSGVSAAPTRRGTTPSSAPASAESDGGHHAH